LECGLGWAQGTMY